MKHPGYEEMVSAMMTDDARFDGVFYVCVKSTGIFCLPSCTARRPRLENVRFYRTREEAMAAGYRGCKRCRAASFPDVTPPWVKTVLDQMRKSVGKRLREEDLAERAGVDGSTIRRYFRSHLRTTPMAFHRRLRLEHARSLMERGVDHLTAALESGFESSSGFRDAYRKHYGSLRTPNNGKAGYRLHDR